MIKAIFIIVISKAVDLPKLIPPTSSTMGFTMKNFSSKLMMIILNKVR